MGDPSEGSAVVRVSASEERFYRRLRRRLHRLAERAHIPPDKVKYVLLAPDLFVLLARLARDPRVPGWAKRRLLACLAYFLSPIDLIPDLLPVGFLDDVVVAAVTLHTLTVAVNAVDSSVLAEHWEGEEEVLPLLQEISSRTEQILGRGFQFVAAAVRVLRRSIVDAGGRGGGRRS